MESLRWLLIASSGGAHFPPPFVAIRSALQGIQRSFAIMMMMTRNNDQYLFRPRPFDDYGPSLGYCLLEDDDSLLSFGSPWEWQPLNGNSVLQNLTISSRKNKES